MEHGGLLLHLRRKGRQLIRKFLQVHLQLICNFRFR